MSILTTKSTQQKKITKDNFVNSIICIFICPFHRLLLLLVWIIISILTVTIATRFTTMARKNQTTLIPNIYPWHIFNWQPLKRNGPQDQSLPLNCTTTLHHRIKVAKESFQSGWNQIIKIFISYKILTCSRTE